MDGKTKTELPQNLDAEASLLGAVLIDGDVIIKIADIISADDFFDPRHKRIYEAITDLYDDHSSIDVLTLSDRLKANDYLDLIGGASYLTELTNFVPTASHVEQYAEIVAQKALRRRLISVSQDMSALGFDEAKGIHDLIDAAETKLFEVSDKHVKQSVVSLETILAESFDRLDEYLIEVQKKEKNHGRGKK